MSQSAASNVVDQKKWNPERLSQVRTLMKESKVDWLWVRSTDRFLNEYVPEADSTRVWLTGFSGSMGEALVGLDQAYVFVDGRYYLQADEEVDAKSFTVVKVPLGTSLETSLLDVLNQKAGKGAKIGFESARFAVADLERAQTKTNLTWVAQAPSLPERARGEAVVQAAPITAIDEAKVDQSCAQKLKAVSEALQAQGVDSMLVQPLDELAWLSNLRGSDIAYSVTFMGVGLVHKGKLLLAVDANAVPATVKGARLQAIEFVTRSDLEKRFEKGAKIGFDPRGTTHEWKALIEQRGATAVAIENPIGPMKAKKGPRELKTMVRAFERADKVIDKAQAWLCNEVSRGGKVSEADFAEKVETLFKESGATGLSFRVISAAGRNGAVIHYSHPNPKRYIRQGELMLLDTGAYYEEGYATDLTRTFLVGPKSQRPSSEQIRYFTLTLKCAIAGMRARFPMGTRGDQLDAITRAPLWREGLNYNHGTGHGVGINVHEFPPRIGPNGTAVLEEGMVFSIEPGVYVDKFGGIRIENLCTLERVKGYPSLLAVKPLTFSPLDQRLIDRKLLNEEERGWLAQYQRGRAPK